MTSASLRDAFLAAHGDVRLLDARDPHGMLAYLRAAGLVDPDEPLPSVERAGDGNMNLTLRVRLRERSLIVKQGRPWVEKYDTIPAPWERTLVEAAFYRAVAAEPDVARGMPHLLHVDERHHVLVLEDLGTGADYTGVYTDRRMEPGALRELLAWLSALGGVHAARSDPEVLANRAMRALNHEHIFALPLRPGNGLDLDRLTDGLGSAADDMKARRDYVHGVTRLGEMYLADGAALVHGDYFPGSWMRAVDGVRIIDPEFCFLGAREFDYGVMLGHCALARIDRGAADAIVDAARQERLDVASTLGFAGAEIMRRLIGVAQLPLPYGLDEKCRLLEMSAALVLTPEKELACWAW